MDQDDMRKKRVRVFGRSGDDDAPPSSASPNDNSQANAGPSDMSVDACLTGDAPTAEAVVAEVPSNAIFTDYGLKRAANRLSGNVGKNRMKCIGNELNILSGSLPPGIFIRYGEDRPDCMKILMVAPKDTPYENGLFEFDLLCPANYPQSPPRMLFRTTDGGSFRFNPNLYADGTVCFSILGTYGGPSWRPHESTILQVLVSIHSMIFCDHPWCNEPGRESMQGTPQSTAYNCQLRPKTVQLAMLDWLEGKGNSLWRDVVVKHFQQHQEKILETIGRWKDAPSPRQSIKVEKEKSAGLQGLHSPPLSQLFPGIGLGQTLDGSPAPPQEDDEDYAPAPKPKRTMPDYSTMAFGYGHTLGGSGSPDPPQEDDKDYRDEADKVETMPEFPSLPSAPTPKPKRTMPDYSAMAFGYGHTLGGFGIPSGATSSTPASKPTGYADPAAAPSMPFGYAVPAAPSSKPIGYADPAAAPSTPFGYAGPGARSSMQFGYPSSIYQSWSQPPPLTPRLLSTYQGTGYARDDEEDDSLEVTTEKMELSSEDDAQDDEEDDSLEVITEKMKQDEATQQNATLELSSELTGFVVKLRQALKGLQSKVPSRRRPLV